MEDIRKAIQEGNEGELGRLLEADPALLETAVGAGVAPLLLAAKHGHSGLVRLLVQMGANINVADECGHTALYYASVQGHEDLVALLLSKGAQATQSGAGISTPLIWASRRGWVGVVRLLVGHTGEEGLEEADCLGMTALHWAATSGEEEVVVFLLSQGAQANRVCRTGDTPLMLACEEGCLGVVRVFFQHLGLQGLEHRTDTGLTPLHCAAQAGREEVVAFLLSQGVRAPVDESNRTPLMVAAGQNRLGVVKMLLQHTGGEGLEDWDWDGRTALQLAALSGHEEVVAFLLSQGAEADIPESNDKTPLMDACHFGHVGVVRLLVRHMGGQGLENRDEDGRTALHWAAFGSPVEVLRLLLLSGADPTVMDHEGMTPHAEAVKSKDQACIAVFEWWEGELERRALLCRATCLHKAHTTQRDMPTSQVPTYLEARVAAGHALPSVEVVLPQQPPEQHEKEEEVDSSSKRKAADEKGDQSRAQAWEAEKHAMLEYVIKTMDEDLVTELLGTFHSGK